MNSQVESIIKTFSRPINHTETLLKLFHQNRLPQNVVKKESTMCTKCLTPWTSGKFNLEMKSSNPKRIARRNYRIERLQLKVKCRQSSEDESKAFTRNIKRLQQQNNHVALYKCFCSKAAKTKVQLRKKQNDKHNKSENVASGTIMSEKTKQHEHDSNPRKEKKTKTKKKKKKTAGLLIPMSKKTNATALTTNNRNLSKISEMFRQQKSIDGTKQQSKLNQFFK
ncbi:unnamed protein product [Chironomus riparius]|uniref:Uncharacterized protein n=1 Tax=Chironomus riparius TaxID=315576 RepID=A0A9N9WM84_9DIPT|nr:unnamed protein product [Chironomus riparius]